MTVQILNKEFQVSCPEGVEDQLNNAAHYLNQKMREIRKSGRVIGIERMAIMAALNIAHELVLSREQNETDIRTMSQHINRLQNKIDVALIDE